MKPIRVFLEVAKRQSFAATATALSMTPASVTRIIAKLEADLGEQLLLRTTRQVSLTSAGATVAARYRPLVAAFDQAAADLSAQFQPNRGRLSINAPLSFGMRVMPGLIDQFRLAYPNIDLTIRLTDRLVDIVSDPADLAIRISRPPTDKSTIWRKLCEVPLATVASPDLFTRYPEPQHPGDLEPDICLSYGDADIPEVWPFERGAEKSPFTTGRVIQANNGDLLFELARAGVGIVMLPEFIVAEGVSRRDLVPVLEDWSVPPLWLSLFYPPYDALPPLVATFTEFFEAYLQEVDGFAF